MPSRFGPRHWGQSFVEVVVLDEESPDFEVSFFSSLASAAFASGSPRPAFQTVYVVVIPMQIAASASNSFFMDRPLLAFDIVAEDEVLIAEEELAVGDRGMRPYLPVLAFELGLLRDLETAF